MGPLGKESTPRWVNTHSLTQDPSDNKLVPRDLRSHGGIRSRARDPGSATSCGRGGPLRDSNDSLRTWGYPGPASVCQSCANRASICTLLHSCEPKLPNAETRPERGFVEADARTRTADPFITSEVLYQLSYVGAAWILACDRVIVPICAGVSRETFPGCFRSRSDDSISTGRPRFARRPPPLGATAGLDSASPRVATRCPSPRVQLRAVTGPDVGALRAPILEHQGHPSTRLVRRVLSSNVKVQFSNFGAGDALLYGLLTSLVLALLFRRTETQTRTTRA